MLTNSEALQALEEGKILVGSKLNQFRGQEVEYLPKEDAANGYPDAYPWHVVGHPDYTRLRSLEIEVKE